jgi:MFS family permease
MIDRGRIKYEYAVSALFFFLWGSVFLDRLGINYASASIMAAFNLTVARFSQLNAAYTIMYALSSIFLSMLSDRLGMRKRILAPLIIAAGALSLAGGILSRSFVQLLVLRALVGMCTGASMTLMMAILVRISPAGTFGRNSGFVAAGSGVFGGAIAPILVTQIVDISSWRVSFAVTGTIMVCAGLLTQLFVCEVESAPGAAFRGGRPKTPLKELTRNRNFILCCFIGIGCMAGYWSSMIFAPMYLTDIVRMTPTAMGYYSSLMGIVCIPLCVAIPAASDRAGRKIVLFFSFLAAVLSPLCMTVFTGSRLSVICYVVFGSIPGVLPTLWGSVIPMESLPDKLKATGGGMTLGFAEVIGGSLWPVAAGIITDRAGLGTGMGIAAALLALGAVMSVMLAETVKKSPRPRRGWGTAAIRF